ncbi:hypothetical protein SAY86_002019 [Trapa natans]|uniref:Pentatricopeptide repeat-containing protein n=1 Tax=Trapa natans TaxID=22666 RepID=A0AAN7R231_TRANT|nr:hypothetical protein SAY86_002019 [Trapa natans]
MRKLCRFIFVRNCIYALKIQPISHGPSSTSFGSFLDRPTLCSSAISGCGFSPFPFRYFSSEIARLGETGPDSNCQDVRRENLYRDADSLYKTVMDNSRPHDAMENALDQVGVVLSSKLVLEVLRRIHFEEKLAFRFFTWAGRRECYEHEPEAYNEMMDILSSTKYKTKQFQIVCDLLNYMKRTGKKAVPVDVLLEMLRNYTQRYLTHLQKFAKKKRIRVKTQPEINAFNLLLDSLCKCSLVTEAEGLLRRMKTKVKPDSNTYNILFFGWCRVRDPTRGMKVLEDMIDMGLKPDNFTYNTAIDTFCRAGMVDEAVELFKFMQTKGSSISSPTARTYATMMVALAQNDRMEDCFGFLQDMISSGTLPDVSTYKEVIEGMCSVGKVEDAYRFLDEMGKNGYPPDIVTYNCFLKVLCESKNCDEALRLYDGMTKSGCMPSVQTFNMLIEMFFGMNDPDGAIEAWGEMEKRGCERDPETYRAMIDGLFGCNKVKEACFLLDEVMRRGMKLPYQAFDSFLMELSVTGNLHDIHRLSEHMRKFYNPAMARRFAMNQRRKSMCLKGK